MLGKGNKLYSIFTGTCPKCHAEKMYINKNAYKLSETLKMRERCTNCHTKYKIEPSFFLRINVRELCSRYCFCHYRFYYFLCIYWSKFKYVLSYNCWNNDWFFTNNIKTFKKYLD